MEILVVEDNERISEFLIKGLEESDFSVTLAENGIDARALITHKHWDLILLDIMLPGIDGIELLQYARFKMIHTPILVVSALGEPADKIHALDAGADDYLVKPFHFEELVARINANIRRARANYGDMKHLLRCGDLTLDTDSHRVKRGTNEIRLTRQEFMLLKLLMENPDKVLTRTQILESVWGLNFNRNTNVVDVYISYLRNKIEIDGGEKMIETIKWRGYLLCAGEE